MFENATLRPLLVGERTATGTVLVFCLCISDPMKEFS